MPRTSGLELVRAFVRSAASDIHFNIAAKAPTVTLSRDAGSGGEEIARRLAFELGVRCFDKELLDAIAAEIHGDKDALSRVDERVRNVADQFLYNFFTQQVADETVYQVHLIHVVLDISAHRGGVIVGRGAHLVIPRAKAFRVKITASEEVCADRIQLRDHLDHEKALDQVRRINRQRAQFIDERFGHDPADTSVFDLIVNTDRFDVDKAALTILYGMHQSGFEIPNEAKAKLSLIENAHSI